MQQQQQQYQNMTNSKKEHRASSAKETMDVLMEMSKILNTGLDLETLATCVRLLESGVNPEALALVINELKKESAAIQVEPNSPAAGFVNHGDAIVAIGGTNAANLTHIQAHQLIRSAGSHLQLTVLKGHFGDIKGIKPKGPIKFSPWRNKPQ